MRLSLLLVGLLLLSASSAQAQAVPRFAGAFALPHISCDCDPKDFVFRTTLAVSGYADPDPAGAVVRTVDRGRLIEGNDWDNAITVVVEPGVAIARHDMTLTGLWHYGTERYLGPNAGEGEGGATLALAAGDRVEYLDSDEGFAYIRHNGIVYGADWPFDERFEWEREQPELGLWFHLVARDDRPAAWVQIRWWDGPEHNVEMLCNTHSLCTGGTGQ